MTATILVIEDDAAIRSLIATTLTTFGYQYRAVGDGATAIAEAVAVQPQLFILDLGLPDMDGKEIITTVRQWTNNPIIVVSARSELEEKLAALDAGADDYLTKPFSTEELLARIRVALRRMDYEKLHHSNESIFHNGGLRIDYAANSVSVDGAEVHLTPIEYKLLCLLARNAGKVLTHNYLLKHIWGNALASDTQSLRVFMATLRKKIEATPSQPQYLQTHIGIGYRMMRISDEER